MLNLVFKIADDNGLLLLDLKDLRSMLQFVGDHAAELKTQYGNVSAASIGAIQRGLLELESQGAESFFGEPALDLEDLIQTDAKGRGIINILAADKLINAPKLYATFLLWLLSELFERLPDLSAWFAATARKRQHDCPADAGSDRSTIHDVSNAREKPLRTRRRQHAASPVEPAY